MKRRLDLALALAHRPRILFLDEPTTGLDIQSRTALWDEVGAARRRGGRHRLPHHPVPGGGRRARRPGRDHRPRPDRRRGHAGGAEGRDRPARPSRRCRASRPSASALRGVLARFGEQAGASPATARAVRLEGGESQLADVVRALDAEGIAIEHLQLHAPSLDDVFLAKTGRSLEGAGEEAEARPRGGGGRRRRERHACAPRSASSRAARCCARCASRRRSSRR